MIRRLSGHLRDGVMALAPTSVGLVIGALAGALLLLAAPPLWYLGRCVLSDVVAYRILNPEAPPTACEPIPDISPAIWLGVLGVLVVAGVVYSIIHRYAVLNRWEWRLFRLGIGASDIYAMATAVPRRLGRMSQKGAEFWFSRRGHVPGYSTTRQEVKT